MFKQHLGRDRMPITPGRWLFFALRKLHLFRRLSTDSYRLTKNGLARWTPALSIISTNKWRANGAALDICIGMVPSKRAHLVKAINYRSLQPSCFDARLPQSMSASVLKGRRFTGFRQTNR